MDSENFEKIIELRDFKRIEILDLETFLPQIMNLVIGNSENCEFKI